MFSKLLSQAKKLFSHFMCACMCACVCVSLISLSEFSQVVVCSQGCNSFDFAVFLIAVVGAFSTGMPMSVRPAFLHFPDCLPPGGHWKGEMLGEGPAIYHYLSQFGLLERNTLAWMA